MLALIAGRGRLPQIVAEATGAQVIGIEGVPLDGLTPDRTFRIERIGSLIDELRDDGVTEVCLAGAIRRVPLDASAVDARTLPYVPRMMEALVQGDDAALRIVVDFFEEAGLRVRGAHELCPELLPPPGDYGPVGSGPFLSDAIRGWEVIAALGSADVGQACVIAKGQVLAVEAAFGTDWMLDTLASRPEGGGGLLCKAPKPGQEMRVDMPAVGPGTVEKAAAAGLDGIAIAADGVMVIDRERTFEAARKHGIVFWVRP